MSDRTVELGTFDSDEPYAYGTTETYEIAGSFLSDCALVEDWGCGRGYFRRFVEERGNRYRGIDLGVDGMKGENPHADLLTDLVYYHPSFSRADGILLRHVLEHNWRWREVLANALGSGARKVCVVLFTPWSDEPRETIAYLAWTDVDPRLVVPVPSISFAKGPFLDLFVDAGWTVALHELTTGTAWGVEHVIEAFR